MGQSRFERLARRAGADGGGDGQPADPGKPAAAAGGQPEDAGKPAAASAKDGDGQAADQGKSSDWWKKKDEGKSSDWWKKKDEEKNKGYRPPINRMERPWISRATSGAGLARAGVSLQGSAE